MLFPKPIGFKFYRDSVRFIGVLAGIAILGFSFSTVEFIRIGVSTPFLQLPIWFQQELSSYRGILLSFVLWI